MAVCKWYLNQRLHLNEVICEKEVPELRLTMQHLNGGKTVATGKKTEIMDTTSF